MEETNDPHNPTLSTKRKLQPISLEKQEEEVVVNQGHRIKAQKLQSATAAVSDNGNTSPAAGEENAEDRTTAPSINSSGSCPQESTEIADNEENGPAKEVCDGEEEEEEEEEEEDVDGEPAVVDRKGKGILMEEEDDEDDSDDDDDDEEEDGSELDGDDSNDLEDDPLAEVDLDNILPSRTRRRSVQPGVYIANNNDDDDDDDNDNDDSDA